MDISNKNRTQDISYDISQNKKRPAFKLKVGNLDISLWSNRNNVGKEYFSLNFNKNYLDDKGVWQKSNNLIITDIPNLIIGLQKAYEFAKIK